MTATVTLWVPLDASGDLTSGVENVLGDVEGVDGLDVYDITEVQPRATDIQVTAVVGVQLAVPAVEDRTVRETLADGFGVMDVARVETDA